MSAKQELLKILHSFHDDTCLEEMAYEAMVYSGCIRGMKEIEEGKGIPHEEVLKMMDKWLEEAGSQNC